jgi:tRNA A-37 threonylcarbamoyl transferase component Bud32
VLATLGRYHLLHKLADGVLAEIYLARLPGTAGFEKLVVLKRIRPEVARNRAALAMFLDEARLAAMLHHSNIAEVIDVDEADDNYFFVMEYVAGRDARAVQAKLGGPVPLPVALAITSSVASALAYAHARTGPEGPLRIVHRDISPGNLLVSYDGAVKLVDFGIARATSRTATTLTGVLRGKVPYMSPEQCRGKVLDRRSDLFSLGAVLYELTTGVRPFTGQGEYELLDQIVHAEVAPPSAHDASYPAPLEAIVMRLLEREPASRYQTADALLGSLEELIAELGLFVSALGVAKFMRELFADELAEPTVGVSRDHQLDATRRARTIADPVGTDVPQIADFMAELEQELSQEAPATETDAARANRRIDTLVDRAFACYGAGDMMLAIAAVELALAEDTGFIQHHRATVMAILEAYVGDPAQVARLAGTRDAILGRLDLMHARVVIDLVDGRTTVEDLVATSGLPPLETYRQLSALLVRGCLELR